MQRQRKYSWNELKQCDFQFRKCEIVFLRNYRVTLPLKEVDINDIYLGIFFWFLSKLQSVQNLKKSECSCQFSQDNQMRMIKATISVLFHTKSFSLNPFNFGNINFFYFSHFFNKNPWQFQSVNRVLSLNQIIRTFSLYFSNAPLLPLLPFLLILHPVRSLNPLF